MGEGGGVKFQDTNRSDESGAPRGVYTPPREKGTRGIDQGLSADKRSAMQGSIAALQPGVVDGHMRGGYG